MKQFVNITSIQNPQVNIQAEKCITFGCQLRGLMLQKFLRPHEGMLFIENYESRLFSSIHMLFMNFNITVIWLNENNRVVDKKIAKRWTIAHLPEKPAKYILELHESRIEDFQIGDMLVFKDL